MNEMMISISHKNFTYSTKESLLLNQLSERDIKTTMDLQKMQNDE